MNVFVSTKSSFSPVHCAQLQILLVTRILSPFYASDRHCQEKWHRSCFSTEFDCSYSSASRTDVYLVTRNESQAQIGAENATPGLQRSTFVACKSYLWIAHKPQHASGLWDHDRVCSKGRYFQPRASDGQTSRRRGFRGWRVRARCQS